MKVYVIMAYDYHSEKSHIEKVCDTKLAAEYYKDLLNKVSPEYIYEIDYHELYDEEDVACHMESIKN